MTSIRPAALPPDLAHVRKLVNAWRATASPYARLPEALWASIMDLLAGRLPLRLTCGSIRGCVLVSMTSRISQGMTC